MKFFLDDKTPISTVENVTDDNTSNKMNPETNSELVILDIDEEYFDVFGSFEDVQKLSQLMQEKHLTEDDLQTILRSVQIRNF